MSPDRLSLQAPAKVNLYLKITGRREDGYHFLATLMQKISLYDQLDFQLGDPGIRLHCPGSDLPADESNLVFQAARLYLDKLHGRESAGDFPGVTITLRKKIPVAAGLGGGSSDAATVLRGLNILFSDVMSEHELLEMGLQLGADVPFFVAQHPAVWATGIGERLQKAVPLSGYRILLVNPGYSVSTRWVYENFTLTADKNINNLKYFQKPETDRGSHPVFLSRPIRSDELENDLEQVTASHYPEIEQLKTRLVQAGAEAALMSGSGPTVLGLFAENMAERAEACAEEFKGTYKSTFLVVPLQD